MLTGYWKILKIHVLEEIYYPVSDKVILPKEVTMKKLRDGKYNIIYTNHLYTPRVSVPKQSHCNDETIKA